MYLSENDNRPIKFAYRKSLYENEVKNYGDLFSPIKIYGVSIDNSFHVRKRNGLQTEFRGLSDPHSRPMKQWNLYMLLDLLICCCAFSFQSEFCQCAQFQCNQLTNSAPSNGEI